MADEELMVFNRNFMIERVVITVNAVTSREFMKEAAEKLAYEILANGCLVHRTQYNIAEQRHREVVTVLVAQRKRTLP